MQTYRWYWKLGVVSALAIGGAIAWSNDCAKAQITPDNTLGAESSVVTPNVDINGLPSDRLDGGAVRGANLFHSFQEFNVSEGRGAYFINPAGIENILSRVTGNDPSDILGTLGVLGNANLFFINPNGIIFGPNASLDVGGSFVASTASSLNLADGNQFSATAPQTTPLLTISVPTGLQFGGNAESVQVQESILQVQAGQTLALVGGDVSVEGGEFGFLSAPEGRIELGGLAGMGMIDIEGQQSEGAFRLSSLRLPDAVERGDVLLTNLAYLDVAGGGGGSIAINARNLDISGDSVVRGGIETNLGFPGAIAGDIELSAQGAIEVANGGIANNVRTGAVGKGGNIYITAGSLSVTDGTQLQALTHGEGDAGNLTINARDTISFDGESGALSNVEATGIGKGGDINITTGSLSVTNGAQLAAGTRGEGDAGNLTINARDTVSFDKESAAFSGVDEGAVGNGGNINITTGSLSFTNGSQLIATTSGQGDAGSVIINARDTVSFDGSSTGVLSLVSEIGKGQGGNIDITSGSLSVTNGARLDTDTSGQGDAGSVTINVTDTVSFDGVGSDGFPSSAFSNVQAGAVGKGGSIDVMTGSLSVTHRAQLLAITAGQGDAGSVTINATDTVSFDEGGVAASAVEPGAVGKGGGIDITTGSLSVTNGGQLVALTRGQGNAGSVTIRATDAVSFDGVNHNLKGAYGIYGVPSAVISTVELGGVGEGGGIDITTGSLSLINGAQLGVSTEGRGDAGDIQLKARSIELNNEAIIQSQSNVENAEWESQIASGDGGNITLQVQNLLLLRRNSAISATAGTAQAGGNGGDINIDTDLLVALENSDITANAFKGRGGEVVINTEGDFRSLDSEITASSQLGPQFEGVVEINTPDVDLQNSLSQLSANFVSPDQVVAGSCLARRNVERGSFTVTGTGGLPRSPYEAMSGRYTVAGVQSIQGSSTVSSRAAVVETALWKRGDPIQEAQGMAVTADGRTIVGNTPQLVALAKAQNLVCHSN